MTKTLIALCLLLSLGCASRMHFEPAAGVEKFESRPKDHRIEIVALNATPQDVLSTKVFRGRQFVVVGRVRVKGSNMSMCMPKFKRIARKRGGSAVIQIDHTRPAYATVIYSRGGYTIYDHVWYHGTVIRYTDGEANP